ncbi:hypothetical protein RI367_001506 [Sorochytrium milnesiophthora]
MEPQFRRPVVPRKGITRRHCIVLFLACAIVFGNYYCYDIPAALNVKLREWLDVPYGRFQWQLNLLYSVYSLPNIFLPLLGGYLVDRLGSSRMIVCFTSVVCVGSVLFAVGMSTRQFALMLVGRVMFGLGGESLEVASAKVTTDWFRRGGLAFAFGINLSSARIASSVQDNLSPRLIGAVAGRGKGNSTTGGAAVNPSVAAWFGVGACVWSALCGAILIVLDRPLSRIHSGVNVDRVVWRKYVEEHGPALVPTHDSDAARSSPSGRQVISTTSDFDGDRDIRPPHGRSDTQSIGDSKSGPLFVPVLDSEDEEALQRRQGPGRNTRGRVRTRTSSNDISSLHNADNGNDDEDVMIRSSSSLVSNEEAFGDEDDEEAQDAEEEEEMSLSQIRDLPRSFWLLCLTAVALYGSVVPFVHVSSDFLQSRWFPGDAETAGSLMAIPDIVSAFGSPLFGFMVDRFGHRGHLLPMAGLAIVAAHVLLNFTSLYPAAPLMLLGAAYALFGAVIWPCVPNIVKPHQTGTAYGLVTVALNLSLAVFPLIVANILAEYKSFVPVATLLISLAGVGILLSTVLNVVESRDALAADASEETPLLLDDGGDDLHMDEEEAVGSPHPPPPLPPYSSHRRPSSPGGAAVTSPVLTSASASAIAGRTGKLQQPHTEELVYTGIEADDEDDVSVRVVADGVFVPISHPHPSSRAAGGHLARRRNRKSVPHRRARSSDGRVERLAATSGAAPPATADVPQLSLSTAIAGPSTSLMIPSDPFLHPDGAATGRSTTVAAESGRLQEPNRSAMSPRSWHGGSDLV